MKLAKIESVYRPNLLINGDFKVNQRGRANYQSNGNTWTYTVDMWRIRDIVGGTVTVNSDETVTVSNANATDDIYFQQMFGTERSGTHTISVSVRNISGNVSLTVGGSEYLPLTNGVNAATREWTSQNNIHFKLEPGASATLEYAALYEGDIDYDHVREDKAIALMRCRQFYQTFSVSYTSYTPNNSLAIVFSVESEPMNGLPTETHTAGNRTNVSSFAIMPLSRGGFNVKMIGAAAGVIRCMNEVINLSCEP